MLVEEGFPKSQDAPVGLNKHVLLTRRVTPQKQLFVTANVSGGRGSRDQANQRRRFVQVPVLTNVRGH
jgi:hypothetical protein